MIYRFVCSLCGETRLGEMSLAGKCAACGEPICYICWAGEKARHCAKHRKADAMLYPAADRPEGLPNVDNAKSRCRGLIEEKFNKYARSRVSVDEVAEELGVEKEMVENVFTAYAGEGRAVLIRAKRSGNTILSRE